MLASAYGWSEPEILALTPHAAGDTWRWPPCLTTLNPRDPSAGTEVPLRPALMPRFANERFDTPLGRDHCRDARARRHRGSDQTRPGARRGESASAPVRAAGVLRGRPHGHRFGHPAAASTAARPHQVEQRRAAGVPEPRWSPRAGRRGDAEARTDASEPSPDRAHRVLVRTPRVCRTPPTTRPSRRRPASRARAAPGPYPDRAAGWPSPHTPDSPIRRADVAGDRRSLRVARAASERSAPEEQWGPEQSACRARLRDRVAGRGRRRTSEPPRPSRQATVSISIGRIEVRAAEKPQAPAVPLRNPPPAPRMSLNEYLRRGQRR